ncbi:MAG: autotransporter-associated beta strand repeat-containing protein [Verrucomicrobia bacterium]|nr:autotransporter-associated beta strand repeat-containing protein [Verrucomicrobiota bacterium]
MSLPALPALPSPLFRRRRCLGLSVLALWPALALGQTFTWDGGGANDSWATGANWAANVAPSPGIGTVIRFDGTTRLTPQQNSSGQFLLHSLVFLPTAGAFTLGGTGGLEFRANAGGASATMSQGSAAPQTLALKPLLLTNDLEIDASGAGALVLASTISGPGAITLKGGTDAGVTQRVTLGGPNANDFSGGLILGTTQQAGPAELSLASEGALGTGAFSMFAGNTLRNGTTAARTIANPFLLLVPTGGGNHVFAGSQSLIFTGDINTLAADKTLQVDLPELRWTGPLSGSALLTKTGAGQLTIGASDNSGFEGGIAVNAGVLRAGLASSLATTIVTLNVAGGLTFPGSTLALGGLAGPTNFTGPTGQLTLGRSSGAATYTGALTTSGPVVKTGTSAQILAFGVSSVGSLSVNNGGLLLNGASLTLTGTADQGLIVGNAAGTAFLALNESALLDTRNTATLLVVGGGLGDAIQASTNAVLQSAGAAIAPAAGQRAGAFFRSGAGWTLTGSLGLGGRSAAQNGGSGRLTVESGGGVEVAGSLDLWTSTSELLISGGTVTAGQVRTPTGASPSLRLQSNPANGFALTVTDDASTSLNAVLGGAGTLRKRGLGTLTLTNEGSSGGRVRIEGGSVALGAPLALQNTVVELYRANAVDFLGQTAPVLGGLAGSADLDLTGLALTVGGAGTDETYSGVLSGSGSLQKVGAGGLVLSGVSTFSGGLTVQAGRVELARFDALPAGVPIAVTGGGVLTTQGSLLALSDLRSARNAGATGWLPGGTIAPAASRTAPTTVSVTVPAGTTQTYVGIFADTAASRLSLTKTGPGTLRLGSDRHTFTGLTTLQQGILELDGAFALPADSTLPGGVRVNAGTTLQLVAGSGLPGRYVSGPAPNPADYVSLASVDGYFAASAPALFANSLANSSSFDFGSSSGGPLRFPAPFDTLPLSNLQVRWSGKFRALAADTYHFYTTADDGAAVFVNGVPVNGGAIALPAGRHDIVVAYYQAGGAASFVVGYAPQGQPPRVLPNALLSYVTNATVGGLTGSGTVDLAGGRLTIAEPAFGIFTGAIMDSNASGGGQLAKSGAGILVLRGTNAASGGLVLAGGALGVNAAAALGSGPLRVRGSGQLFADSVDVTLPNAVSIEAAADLTIGDDLAGPRKLTFTGPCSGPGAFLMAGTGECVLESSGASLGLLEVRNGRLTIAGRVSASAVNVVAGTLALNGGTLSAASGPLTVLNGTLTGSGLVTGPVTNYGTIDARSQTLTLTGPVTNYGLLRAISGGVVDASTSSELINHGTIDLISGSLLLPANFQNFGLLLDSRLVRVKTSSRVGNVVTLTIDGYSGHTYRLQRSTSLSGAAFTDIGAPQNGATGATLTFTDQNASGASGFYRIAVD